MGYAVGASLAILVAGFARVVGLDRDRGFYPTVLVVVGSYYVLFAVMGGSTRALLLESMTMGGFALVAVAGFKRSPWIVAAGLVAHGVFDYFHAGVVSNPGVPEWWPAFCMAYDVAAGVLLACSWLLRHKGALLFDVALVQGASGLLHPIAGHQPRDAER